MKKQNEKNLKKTNKNNEVGYSWFNEYRRVREESRQARRRK